MVAEQPFERALGVSPRRTEHETDREQPVEAGARLFGGKVDRYAHACGYRAREIGHPLQLVGHEQVVAFRMDRGVRVGLQVD
jgi:hypothetical protein